MLSNRVHVEYKCTDVYDPGYELSVAWNDPEIGIRWSLGNPELSAKDAAAPRLREILDQLPAYESAGR